MKIEKGKFVNVGNDSETVYSVVSEVEESKRATKDKAFFLREVWPNQEQGFCGVAYSEKVLTLVESVNVPIEFSAGMIGLESRLIAEALNADALRYEKTADNEGVLLSGREAAKRNAEFLRKVQMQLAVLSVDFGNRGPIIER